MGLSTLVVHLKSNYSDLQSGLKSSAGMVNTYGTQATSALQETAKQAKKLQDEIKAAADPGPFRKVGQSAVQLKDDLKGITAGGSLTQVAKSAQQLGNDLNDAADHTERLRAKTLAVSIVTGKLGQSNGMLAGTMRLVTRVTAMASDGMLFLTNTMRMAAGGIALMLRGLALAFAPLLLALRMARVMFIAAMQAAAVMTAPIVFAAKGTWTLTKAVMALLAPFVRLTQAILGLKSGLRGLLGPYMLFGGLLSRLPPRIRAVVVGLMALGAAGKAGNVVLRALTATVKAAGSAARLLLLPLQALRNPMAALRTLASMGRRAIVLLGLSLKKLAMLSFRAARGLLWLGFTAARKAAVGLGRLAGRINMLAGSMLTGLLKGFVAAGIAGVVWGGTLAAAAETAQTSFTTLLGSAEAAKQVLSDLRNFSASTPFQLNDLRDASKLLLNAQVPTDQLIGRMTMLGDIAAGTGKPIGDFARIYAKVKATGKVSLETLNQLAERGVPIYQSLAAAMGVSRSEMLNMISRGKVGFTDLHAALQSTTAAGGLFAGGMVAQSKTLAGLWSTLKDNVGFALQDISQQLMTAFDFKGLMTDAISFVQGLSSRIVSLAPIIQQTANTIVAGFQMIWQVGSTVWNGLVDLIGLGSEDIGSLIVTALAAAEFAFKNWKQIAALAVVGLQLDMVEFGNDVSDLFTRKIPTVLTWLADNWKSIFRNIASFTGTVFDNMGRNVKSAMTSIWDFMKSGGTSDLKFTWTPLTEGFKSTLSELPDIPKRKLGPLEAALNREFESLKKATGDGLSEHVAARLSELDEFRNAMNHTNEQAGIVAPNNNPPKDDGTEKQVEVKIAGALSQGTADAYSAIINAMEQQRKGDEAARILKLKLELQQHQAEMEEERLDLAREQGKPVILGSLS